MAMTDLVIAMRDILHRQENLDMFMSQYIKTLSRIESKLDSVCRQTIKEDYVRGHDEI